ncbi:MAG: AI-2E family transporter [Firmicutes bacterium]|nr:AI-2E family transporter [Bacillota bacterium]
MFKFIKDNHLRYSLYLMGVILISITFYRATENLHILDFFPIVFKVLSPFIIGIIVAYILNAPVRFIENKIFRRIKFLKPKKGTDEKTLKANARKDNFCRNGAIISAMVLLLGVLIWMVAYILPEIVQSVQKIVDFIMNLDYINIRFYIARLAAKYNILITEEMYEEFFKSITNMLNSLADVLQYLPDMVQSLVGYTINFAKGFINAIIGIFVAFYILSDKDNVLKKCELFAYVILPPKAVDGVKTFIKALNKAFESFFIGKFMDSFIIGLIFFAGAMILGLPYPLLLSLIIGVTNMIPYFGPFIGAVPVAILVLFVSPIKCLWVIIFIIVLQQFDGIILGPKILGDSIGVKPLAVMFAIIVGGAVAGPLGMFFGVPIFAVIIKGIMDFGEMRKNVAGGAANG